MGHRVLVPPPPPAVAPLCVLETVRIVFHPPLTRRRTGGEGRPPLLPNSRATSAAEEDRHLLICTSVRPHSTVFVASTAPPLQRALHSQRVRAVRSAAAHTMMGREGEEDVANDCPRMVLSQDPRAIDRARRARHWSRYLRRRLLRGLAAPPKPSRECGTVMRWRCADAPDYPRSRICGGFRSLPHKG